MLKNEYLSDKEFASFTSGDWTEEQDETPAENTDLFEPESRGYGGIVAAVSVILVAINAESNKKKYIIQTGVPKIFVFVSGGIAITVALAAIFVGRRDEIS